MRPRQAQQAGERGAAGLPHELVDGRGEGEFAAPEQAVQELRHEGLEPVGANPATGLPQDLGRGGDLWAVQARAPAGPRQRPGPRRATEQPNGRLPVDAGHGHDFVQQPVLLGASGAVVPPRCLAAYSRRLARVTVTSWVDSVTLTFEQGGPSR